MSPEATNVAEVLEPLEDRRPDDQEPLRAQPDGRPAANEGRSPSDQSSPSSPLVPAAARGC